MGKSPTIYVCGICGSQGRSKAQLINDGWLIAQRRDFREGALVITCPSCRTVNSERLAEGFDPAPIFDLEDIKRMLYDADPDYDTFNDDDLVKSVFIGTVQELYPSGKYYTQFASSNVKRGEAEEDYAWREQAESELESIGVWLESGEGDPCDLFAVGFAADFTR